MSGDLQATNPVQTGGILPGLYRNASFGRIGIPVRWRVYLIENDDMNDGTVKKGFKRKYKGTMPYMRKGTINTSAQQ